MIYHLFHGKRSDIADSDSDVQHLSSNEVTLSRAFKPGHLNQHRDVPLKVGDVLVVVLAAHVDNLGQHFISVVYRE